ncbi:ATP-binding protein [Streptomyces sp. NPDC093509]|uniref:ATP-binding protein n=1 Tax=Streptomyces sp. NPDC093509 TaxID=3154982 RepID=UPI00344E3156
MRHPSTTDGHTGYPLESACRPVRTAQARQVASDFLVELNPPPPERTVQNLMLLVSELVTNAIRYAGTVTSVKLRADRHRIQVIVEDPSPVRPQNRTPDLTSGTGGFGWPMVQRLAREVTIAPTPDGTGKAITATLPR